MVNDSVTEEMLKFISIATWFEKFVSIRSCYAINISVNQGLCCYTVIHSMHYLISFYHVPSFVLIAMLQQLSWARVTYY